jgi:hypothetical protein
MTGQEKTKTGKRNSFYEDLFKFTLDWMTARNKEGEKPVLSEIIGGLEMVKTDIYWTQNWFVEKLVNRQLKDKIVSIIAKLEGKDITILSDGSIIIEKNTNKSTKDSKEAGDKC